MPISEYELGSLSRANGILVPILQFLIMCFVSVDNDHSSSYILTIIVVLIKLLLIHLSFVVQNSEP